MSAIRRPEQHLAPGEDLLCGRDVRQKACTSKQAEKILSVAAAKVSRTTAARSPVYPTLKRQLNETADSLSITSIASIQF